MRKLSLALAVAAALLVPSAASAARVGFLCSGWRLTVCDAWLCCDYRCTTCYRTVDGEPVEVIGDGHCEITACREAV